MASEFINKVKKDSITYQIEDSATKQALQKEIERATREEQAIRADILRSEAKGDYAVVTINKLIDPKSDGSIQEIVNTTISETVSSSPQVFETIQAVGEWMESDTTGAAALTTQVNNNTQEIESLKNSTVYLSESEWNALVDSGMVRDDVEYNIYEDETV